MVASLAAALDDLVSDALEAADVATIFAIANTRPPANPLPRPRYVDGSDKTVFRDTLAAMRAWARLQATLDTPRYHADEALDELGRRRPDLAHMSPTWRSKHAALALGGEL